MNPRNIFNKKFPESAISLRRLRSIAFHLRISVNIFSSSVEELVLEIGNCLIRQYTFEAGGEEGISSPVVRLPNNLYDELQKLATRHYVSSDNFLFLKNYSRKSIIFKLRKTGIASDLEVTKAFGSAQDVEIILGYLCDISKMTADEIVESLMELENQLQVMRITWSKHIAWFSKEKDKDMERLRAAAFYSGKQFHGIAENKIASILNKSPKIILMPVVEGYDDIEIYFHRLDVPSPVKVLIFEKIRDLYNTRSSRAENKKNKKKDCSFILTAEAEHFIKKLAKERQMKGSALLNNIFQEINKQGLLDLLKKSPNLK